MLRCRTRFSTRAGRSEQRKSENDKQRLPFGVSRHDLSYALFVTNNYYQKVPRARFRTSEGNEAQQYFLYSSLQQRLGEQVDENFARLNRLTANFFGYCSTRDRVFSSLPRLKFGLLNRTERRPPPPRTISCISILCCLQIDDRKVTRHVRFKMKSSVKAILFERTRAEQSETSTI